MSLPKEEQDVTSATPQSIYCLVSFWCCFTSGYLPILFVSCLGFFKIGNMSQILGCLILMPLISLMK